MDFTPLIAQAWSTFAWLIPLMILIGLLKSPLGKGYIGELLVRLFAHWQLDRQTYQRLHNVTLATPDGTTQIDHVFLSRYGVFVLETKNMSGWIFGSEQQRVGGSGDGGIDGLISLDKLGKGLCPGQALTSARLGGQN